jgi:hypothetical protein
MTSRHQDVVALVKGATDVASVAARHGVSEAEVVAWKAMFLDGLEAGARRSSIPSRRLVMTAALVLAVGLGLTSREALSQVGCTVPSFFTTLGLKYFCADAPALAADVNANTQSLATWMQQKLGTLGNANIANTGNISTTGTLTATTVASSYFSPPYAGWTGTGSGVGAGGAGIVNDNGTYKALMVVGNSSDGTGSRKVRLYDDVRVEGALTVAGALYVGNLRCRGVSTGCSDSGGGNAHYLDRLNASCAGNEFMQRFQYQRCDGTTARYDITCCAIAP